MVLMFSNTRYISQERNKQFRSTVVKEIYRRANHDYHPFRSSCLENSKDQSFEDRRKKRESLLTVDIIKHGFTSFLHGDLFNGTRSLLENDLVYKSNYPLCIVN